MAEQVLEPLGLQQQANGSWSSALFVQSRFSTDSGQLSGCQGNMEMEMLARDFSEGARTALNNGHMIACDNLYTKKWILKWPILNQF